MCNSLLTRTPRPRLCRYTTAHPPNVPQRARPSYHDCPSCSALDISLLSQDPLLPNLAVLSRPDGCGHVLDVELLGERGAEFQPEPQAGGAGGRLLVYRWDGGMCGVSGVSLAALKRDYEDPYRQLLTICRTICYYSIDLIFDSRVSASYRSRSTMRTFMDMSVERVGILLYTPISIALILPHYYPRGPGDQSIVSRKFAYERVSQFWLRILISAQLNPSSVGAQTSNLSCASFFGRVLVHLNRSLNLSVTSQMAVYATCPYTSA